MILKRKKNFILFELLIAFALLTIAVLPFLRFPYNDLKQQSAALYERELEKYAATELAKWEVALHQGKEGLKERMFSPSKAMWDRENNRIKVKLTDKWEKEFIRKLKIFSSGQKQTEEGASYSLVNIELKYYPTTKKSKPLLKVNRQLVAKKKG